MTAEELLKPRFKVEVDYPNSDYKIGDILYPSIKGRVWVHGDEGSWTFDPLEYPAIFRELKWAEHRDVKDMPEYVKSRHTGSLFKCKDWNIIIVNELHSDSGVREEEMWFVDQNDTERHVNGFLPATEEEYLSFINSK